MCECQQPSRASDTLSAAYLYDLHGYLNTNVIEISLACLLNHSFLQSHQRMHPHTHPQSLTVLSHCAASPTPLPSAPTSPLAHDSHCALSLCCLPPPPHTHTPAHLPSPTHPLTTLTSFVAKLDVAVLVCVCHGKEVVDPPLLVHCFLSLLNLLCSSKQVASNLIDGVGGGDGRGGDDGGGGGGGGDGVVVVVVVAAAAAAAAVVVVVVSDVGGGVCLSVCVCVCVCDM
jgi:hypothetical protein